MPTVVKYVGKLPLKIKMKSKYITVRFMKIGTRPKSRSFGFSFV